MQDLNGPAVVRGIVDGRQPVEFRDSRSDFTRTVTPHDGGFRVLLPQGQYAVRQGTTRTTITALSGGSYNIDLRRDKAIDYVVTTETGASGDIVLRITARGTGQHTFSIRADNLDLKDAAGRTMTFPSDSGGELEWHAHIHSADTPWVAVIVADNTISNRRELTGTAPLQSTPGD
jgi:hypothetical protein